MGAVLCGACGSELPVVRGELFDAYDRIKELEETLRISYPDNNNTGVCREIIRFLKGGEND